MDMKKFIRMYPCDKHYKCDKCDKCDKDEHNVGTQ